MWAAGRLTVKVYEQNTQLRGLQFYLVSSSSADPWPGVLPLQLRDPIITAMATQTPFPKGCLGSLQNT